MVAVGRVGIETVSQLEFDFVEAEIAVGMVQHLPALVRGDGGGEIIVESRELKLGVEAAAEGAGEDHAAGRIEFGVPEMLDADPGAEAEENDDGTGKLLMRDGGEEREAGTDAAEAIDEEHDAPGGQSGPMGAASKSITARSSPGAPTVRSSFSARGNGCAQLIWVKRTLNEHRVPKLEL